MITRPRGSWTKGKLLVLLLSSAALQPLSAQDNPALTLDRIYSSAEFAGDRLGSTRWLDGGQYTRIEQTRGGQAIVQHNANGGDPRVLISPLQIVPGPGRGPLSIDDYFWSEDGTQLLIYTNSQRVWRDNTRGDYWVLNRDSGVLFQLGADLPSASLMFAKFSSDGSRVAYVSRNNIYVQDVASRLVTQITTDGTSTIINGTFDWVYEEEFGIQDGFRWSPDGTHIAYWQLDASEVGEFLMINNTDSLYSFTIPVQYPKAGTTNSSARVGIISAEGGETQWVQLEGDPRNNYIARMDWAANSEELVLQYLNRLQNRLQFTLANAATGAVRTVFTESDEAWVNVVDDLIWMDEGASFTWVSERDGWRRVYKIDRQSGEAMALTPAGADVIGVEVIDVEGGWIYYNASPDDPIRRYLFRAPLDGSMRAERLSPEDQPGVHRYQVAPDGAWAFDTYSTFDAPSTTTLVSLPDHRVQHTVVDNRSVHAAVTGLKMPATEFLRLEVEEGVVLDGWMMKPRDFDPTLRYPVLFYVYGEPAGQTVLDRWGGARRLWHQLLTEQGYIVVSFDGRGTPAPRGRDWRKIIYGEVGTLASRDQAGAARALAEEFPFVDPERLAIWGWSGGGSQTLNSIFRYPEVFATGMAVAPVPDQRYYDTIYQERYMGLPQDNARGYRLGSPITYADQLEGNLLIIHGTGDDNVHYQGTEALVNKLVAAGKHFTMMAYPNRSHGIREGAGTTRHVYGLLTRYLNENLPAGGRPAPPTT